MAHPSENIEGKYWLDMEGILRIKIYSETDVHITLDDAEKHVQRCISASDGRPRLLLIDVHAVFRSISKEASEFIRDSYELNDLRKAEGFIANTLATHLMIRFTHSFPGVPYPCQVFTNERRALNWLREFE